MINFIKNIFSSKRNPDEVQLDSSSELSNNSELINTAVPFKAVNTVNEEPDENEIERIINAIAVAEVGDEQNRKSGTDFDFGDRDSLFEDAARLIVSSQMGSTSLIQRRMKLNYNRAGCLMDQLEAAGVVGPNQGSAAREVLFKTLEELEEFLMSMELGVPPRSHKGKNTLAQFIEKYKERIDKRIMELRITKDEEGRRIEKERIKEKLLQKDRIKGLHKEALKELIEEGKIFNQFINKEGRRESIPQDVMDAVWNRDGGKCVQCGGQENLEFDHIIPFSKGGATTYRNMQLLCKNCNIEKSNKIG